MIPQLIVLEGPDCAGKTTLGMHLWNVIPQSIYWHLTSTPALNEAMYDYQVEAMLNIERLIHNGIHVVLDRFWPSEYVYSKIFRPQHFERAKEHWQEFHSFVLQHGIYIYCNDSEVVERHAEKQDPDHPYDPVKFAQIVEGYAELFDTMVHEDYVARFNILVHGHDLHNFSENLHRL